MGAAEAGDAVDHAPPVAVEHRQRVQVHVPVGHLHVHREGDRVQPDVAVGELHSLRPRGRAARVVDRGGGVLVGLGPWFGLGVELEQRLVGLGADREPVLRAGHVPEVALELGIDEQDRCAGVLDDVLHLVGVEPEVDRHEHPTEARHAVERREQPGGVVADDGDALAVADTEGVETGGLGSGQLADPAPRRLAPRRGRLVGLVDDGHTVAVDGDGAVEEVSDSQRHTHGAESRRRAGRPRRDSGTAEGAGGLGAEPPGIDRRRLRRRGSQRVGRRPTPSGSEPNLRFGDDYTDANCRSSASRWESSLRLIRWRALSIDFTWRPSWSPISW